MVISPSSSALDKGKETVIVVSRSEAVTFSVSPFSSNKKSSNMGKVLLAFKTPLSAVRFLSNDELVTINFMPLIFYLVNNLAS